MAERGQVQTLPRFDRKERGTAEEAGIFRLTLPPGFLIDIEEAGKRIVGGERNTSPPRKRIWSLQECSTPRRTRG